MLGVLQKIAGSNGNLSYQDIEFLAYQLVKKHSIRAVSSMDTKTLNKEINSIIGG